MYYGGKKKPSKKKKRSLHYNFTIKTLRFTDTIRALVKEAEDIVINCSCKRFFYKQLNC